MRTCDYGTWVGVGGKRLADAAPGSEEVRRGHEPRHASGL